jgi:hypothetical protein
VNGSSVSLTWSVPSTGPVIGYRLEAGSASGLSDVANTLIGPAPSLSAAVVPPGTYYVRVRAIGLDGESEPSNEVIVAVGSVGACTAPPGAPSGLTAIVNLSLVTLRWQPGGGCAAGSYTLYAGSTPGLSNVAIVNLGPALTLTASAPAGTYYVRVQAHNAFGSSAHSNEIVVQIGGGAAPVCDLAAHPDAVQWPAQIGGNNHVYEYVYVGRDITWDEARVVSAATGPGWHLATITSAAENSFVKSLFANDRRAFNCCLSSNASGPWLGAFASTFRSNDWRWLTGEPFVYADWGPAEPFGNGDRLSYAEFGSRRLLAWNDVPSVYPLSPRAYIRECSPELAR